MSNFVESTAKALRRGESTKAEHRVVALFYTAMGLFDPAVEVSVVAMLDLCAQHFSDGMWVRVWFSPIPNSLISWDLAFFLWFPFGSLFSALFTSLSTLFRSRAALQLAILALRHQLGVLQRSVKRSKLTLADRLL